MRDQRRIGILTLHRSFNYGAVLQGWSLKKACELLGHEVEVIDYNPYGSISLSSMLRHRPSVIYRYLRHAQIFGRFVKKHLNLTKYTKSSEWIKNNPPREDIYIVGSDMVWSKEVAGEIGDAYFLDFAPNTVWRIAYAASTGGNPIELSESQLEELRKFSAISVRERQTVASVQEKVEVPVIDVCDPTLLLTQEEYKKIEKKPLWLPKHYVVYFDLGGDPFCEDAVKMVSQTFNIPIINLAGRYRSWTQYNYLAPTLEQWLYILHHADFVCTNSYHGAAFSIIFRRPFFSCKAHVGGQVKSNGRAENLLEQTNLLDRYVDDINQVKALLKTKIIYDEESINQYRNRSLEWLKNAIKDEKS